MTSLCSEREIFMNLQEPNPEFEKLNMITGIEELLNHFHVFSGAPPGALKLFAYLAKKEEFRKGQVIVEKGESCDRCFFIVSGMVDIYQPHSGHRFHLQLLCEDFINYFGELALLSKFSWFFSARAWSDVTLLSISREAFSKVMEKYPESYRGMVKKIIDLHIERYADQSAYLLDNLDPAAWREDPPEKSG